MDPEQVYLNHYNQKGKELREELKRRGDKESLEALARTTFQDLQLVDYQHFVGRRVKVQWKIKDSSLASFSCPDSEGIVKEIVRFACGEIMAFLENYNHPVRVERLKEVKTSLDLQ